MHLHKKLYGHQFKQLSFLIACFLDCMTTGATLGYSATLIPQLEDDNSSLKVIDSQAVWIASILLLGTLPGSILGSILVEKLGRRLSYILVALGNLTGWTLIALAHSATQILVGRFISGVAVGASYPICYVFIVEISTTNNRGPMLNMLIVGGILGVQMIDLMGTYVRWDHTALICSAMPATYLVMFFFLKDSYTWYLNKQDSTAALEAFQYYKGSSKDALNEFKEIEENIKNRPSYSAKDMAKLCVKPEFLKPCAIITFYIAMVNFCGGFGIIFYSITIMKQVTNIDEYLGTAILDTTRTLATILAGFLINRFYRRTLSNIGGAICTCSLVSLSVFLYLFELNSDVENNLYGTGSLVCMMIYTFAYFISLMPVSNVIMGELLAGPTRPTGMGLITILNFVFYYLIVQFLPSMFEILGAYCVFTIFSIFSLFGSCVLYFILPETKNKSCIEIEESFKK